MLIQYSEILQAKFILGPCHGDSGGPVWVDSSDNAAGAGTNTPQLVGILSTFPQSKRSIGVLPKCTERPNIAVTFDKSVLKWITKYLDVGPLDDERPGCMPGMRCT